MHLPGSALEGGAVFEGEGQAAIRVGRGVVQQAAPELFAEGGDLAVLLFQNPEEVLHRTSPLPDVADLLGDRVLLFLGLFELLAEGIEALLVFGLVLRDRGVLPDHLLDHQNNTENTEWSFLSYEEKNRQLFLRQKKTLDMFLERGAISQAQHDKSLHDLIEKMGIKDS